MSTTRCCGTRSKASPKRSAARRLRSISQARPSRCSRSKSTPHQRSEAVERDGLDAFPDPTTVPAPPLELAIAVVITIAVLGVAVQELRTGITQRAIGWLSLVAVCGLAFRGRAARAFENPRETDSILTRTGPASLWEIGPFRQRPSVVGPVTAAVSRSRRPRYRLRQHVTPRAQRLAARRAGVLMQTPSRGARPGGMLLEL